MSAFIEIENLSYAYPVNEGETPRPALDGVSLRIEAGSFTAVIGRNGSGKSTLAKQLNALLRPDAGRVLVDGLDTADDAQIWEIRRRVGMVFQNPDNQLVSSIVEDDVAFGPENLGVPTEEIRERVDEALAAVSMEAQRQKGPHLLSGGQKQRVAIAGVLAMRPRCIVLDEATAMLDPKGRQEVMEILEHLHRQGITVVLITHFMEEAARAERIVVMSRGKVCMDGSPAEVFARGEELRALDLELPFAIDLAERLREGGLALPQGILTEDDLLEALCPSK